MAGAFGLCKDCGAMGISSETALSEASSLVRIEIEEAPALGDGRRLEAADSACSELIGRRWGRRSITSSAWT